MKSNIRCILAAALLFGAALVASSPAFARTITLNEGTKYNITADITLIEDSDRNKTPDSVLKEYREGEGSVAAEDHFHLHYNSSPYWMVFDVRNLNPLQNNWILDFGNSTTGTNGIADRIAIYTASDTSAPIMEDGRYVENKTHIKGQNKNAIPLRLKSKGSETYLIYIKPTSGAPVTIYPVIRDEASYEDTLKESSMREHLMQAAALIASVLMLLMFSGYRSSVPILVLAYTFLAFGIYKTSDELIPYGNNTPAVYVDMLYAALVAVALLLTGRLLDNTGFGSQRPLSSRLLDYSAALLLLLTFMGEAQIGLNEISTYIVVRFVPFFAAVAIIAVTLLTFSKSYAVQFSNYILAWIFFIAALVTKEVNGSVNVLMVFLLLHIITLYMAAIGFVVRRDLMQKRRAKEAVLKKEAELEISKTRDFTNQNRLLSVIQREKELLLDLKKQEEARLQAISQAREAAENATKSKSEFLAVISHEIRTPMTGIMGTISLLKETGLNDKQKEYVETLHKTGNVLLMLLNDILDLSKAEAGRMDIEAINFNLKDVVSNVIAIFEAAARDKKIILTADIDKTTPLALNGDPAKLRQVLSNLISNALKFTSSGSVTVHIEKIGETENDEHELRFSVADTGIGIPKAVQQHIFSPYAQATSSISRRFGGTGLGLAICNSLVHAMGGEIGVESEEGEGTTFFFTLPLLGSVKETKAPPRVTIEEEAVSPEQGATQKNSDELEILVVDDNSLNQKVIAAMLEKTTPKVITVGSVRDAMNEIDKHDFDMIFMDMEMPEINGITATRMIRSLKNSAKARVPIIAMTANNDSESIAKCLQAGMNNFLEKPIDTDKLYGIIDNMAKKKAELQKPAGSALPQNTSRGEVLKKQVVSSLDAVTSKTFEIASEENLVDNAIFDNVRNGLHEKDFMNMIYDLYKSIDDLEYEIDKAWSKRDLKKIYMLSHNVSGVAANFGLKALSLIAKKLQTSAHDNAEPEMIEKRIALLKDTYKRTQKHVRDILSGE